MNQCEADLLQELAASKQRQWALERRASELRCQEVELWCRVDELWCRVDELGCRVDELGRIISAIRADEEEAVLPAGFTEGLDQMLEDLPSVKPGAALYFPMCSYGAQWAP